MQEFPQLQKQPKWESEVQPERVELGRRDQGGCDVRLAAVQEFPQLQKQPKWESEIQPERVNWDAEIRAAIDKGKDVPEVTWVKPGEDEAMKASCSM